jgi:thermitase
MSTRSVVVLLSIGLLAVPGLRAGKEFTASVAEPTVSNELIVRLKPGANIAAVIAAAAPQALARLIDAKDNVHVLQVPPGIRDLISKALAAHGLVDYVEPNRIRKINVTSPNDASYSSQWALTTIKALKAWSYVPNRYLTSLTAGTGRVKVAVLDTGADCTHPDFKNIGGTSTDSAFGGQLLFASSQALIATTVASPACSWQDDHGHGTHTAGTVAAATQNAAGVASIGYAVQVIVYKVLDKDGSGPDSTIATAIRAAADAGAQVISMSLGASGYSQTLQSAINYAWQRNALVVAAAGNTGDSTLQYPGAANHALGVAATDSTNSRASFSSYGNWVKIAAPGVSILSTLPTYGTTIGGLNYGSLSGTSMATPHVAGLAGLVALTNPNISAAAIAQRIQRSAQAGNGGWDQFRAYGVIDAAAAVSGAVSGATAGSLTGQVVDSAGLPLSGIVVMANGQGFSTASDGLFRIANLPGGTYGLTASGGAFAPVSMQAAVVNGADTMLTVRMGVLAGHFSGAVTVSGTALGGAVVEALSGGLIQGTSVTDANGVYHLYLPAGTYDLRASATGDINASVNGQSVGGGASATVNLAISKLGNISGVVKDSSGAGVGNAAVDISGASFSAGATTDAAGNFTTVGLPAGTYTVTAVSGANTTSQAGVSVSPNLTTPVTLVFNSANPLTISAVTATNITSSSAVITWTTDRPADSQVFYGATSAYGSATPLDGALLTTHSVTLSGLSAGTTQHYQARSKDAQGIAATSNDFNFTTAAAGGGGGGGGATGPFQFHMETSEIPGRANGDLITPASAPAGLTGRVVVAGSGSVNFQQGQTGNGVYFLNCCSNTNSAYFQFSGAGVGSVFNAAQGQITFYLRSRYSFAQRAAVAGASRYAFDVRDGNGTHQLSFRTEANPGYLAFAVNLWGTTQYYFVPAGSEDVMFGNGVSLKVGITWNAGSGSLFFNDVLARSFGFPAASPSWSAASNFDVGAYEYLSYGGYSQLDDIIDEFSVSGGVSTGADTTPPTVSMTAPGPGTTVSGTVTVTANATDNIGVTGVQFKVDGVNLGGVVTGAGPTYSTSWNTTTATNGSHTVAAVASDAAGNSGAAPAITVTVSNAAQPPVVSNAAASVTASSATITWTTNKAADSQVAYGSTSQYGSLSQLDSTLVTSHRVQLSGLSPSTTYHYQARSADTPGNTGTSADLIFTTSAAGGVTPSLQIHADASEVSGVTNNSTITPAVAPPSLNGQVVVAGSGTVNFTGAQNGTGVYFLNCCSNGNTAYYQFTGTGVGSAFNAAQGQITFYLKSRYSFAQRNASAAASRYAFDVRDGNGTHQLGFRTEAGLGYLAFGTVLWGATQYFFVPAGTEDTLFGSGVTLKVTISWQGGAGKLLLNDVLVSSIFYSTATPNWSAASLFNLGAYEYMSYGGYNSSDDVIDEFTVYAQ